MANNNINLITIDEVRDMQIDKKFVLINSSLYTEEAFGYILDKVSKEGAIAFVSDTKKIWAQGRYFGGDIFQDDLYYYTKLLAFNEDNGVNSIIEAGGPKSTLSFKGLNHVRVSLGTGESDDPNYNTGKDTVFIDYNLNDAVNKQQFEFEVGAKYNFDVVDGKLTMKKYVPLSISLSSLRLIEYYTGDEFALTDADGNQVLDEAGEPVTFKGKQIEIKLTRKGTYKNDPNVQIAIAVSLDIENYIDKYVTYDPNTDIISAIVPENTDTTFTIKYTDVPCGGSTESSVSTTQGWGYGIVYGHEEILLDNFYDFDRYITKNNITSSIIINQNVGEYGWFACPDQFKPAFIDASTNLQGGWYNLHLPIMINDIVYERYCTDNDGLGKVKWNIQ